MAILVDRLDRIYTNPTELWVNTAENRRFLRNAGEEEAVVIGERGDFALFSAYMVCLSRHPDRFETGMRELQALSDTPLPKEKTPEALWEWACEALGRGVTARELLARRNLSPIASLDWLFSFEEAACTSVGQWLVFAREWLDAFADMGCTEALLTVEDRLPACLRMKEDDIDRALGILLNKGEKGLPDKQKEAILARLLFSILPMLRARKMTLILRAGQREWGDGRFDCSFEPLSLVAYAERLGDQMPKMALCPRSEAAREAMERLLGVLPSIDGEAAVRMIEDLGEGSLLSALCGVDKTEKI